jgi:hypothetical protein
MISQQFRVLEMIVWPTECFVQLYSLLMDQLGPKYVAVL